MAPVSDDGGERTISIEGSDSVEIPLDSPPEWVSERISTQSVRFECASGDWVEREYEAFPLWAVVEAAAMPGETTHVELESRDGYSACVPLSALSDAVIAVGEGDGRPRFISPEVVGPRAIKNLVAIRPLSLAAGEDRESHEQLPIDGK